MWMSIFRQRMSLMCCDAKSVMHMKGVTTLTILTRQPIIVNSALKNVQVNAPTDSHAFELIVLMRTQAAFSFKW